VPVALYAMEQPPDDPDAWSDEQWIEWLHATEDNVDVDQRVFAPRLSSPTGVVLGAAMMGLQKGMYGDVQKPEIVIEIGAKGLDDGVKIDLDPDDPSESTVVVEAKPSD
jgi:hypothetical protein